MDRHHAARRASDRERGPGARYAQGWHCMRLDGAGDARSTERSCLLAEPGRSPYHPCVFHIPRLYPVPIVGAGSGGCLGLSTRISVQAITPDTDPSGRGSGLNINCLRRPKIGAGYGHIRQSGCRIRALDQAWISRRWRARLRDGNAVGACRSTGTRQRCRAHRSGLAHGVWSGGTAARRCRTVAAVAP